MARGRRVNSNGEKSKQLLLEKAIELFSTHGYHQTKISDIVKAANLTQPTFYLYFQSKESLFKDLNAQFQIGLYDIFEEDTVDLLHVHERVADKLRKTFHYFLKNPNLTRIGFYYSDEAMHVKNELAQRLIRTLENEQGQYLLFNRVETHTLAESLVGSVERLTLTGLLTNKSNPEKLAKDISNIYFIESKELVR